MCKWLSYFGVYDENWWYLKVEESTWYDLSKGRYWMTGRTWRSSHAMTELDTMFCISLGPFREIPFKVCDTVLMGVHLRRCETSIWTRAEKNWLFGHQENGTESKRLLKSTGTYAVFLAPSKKTMRNQWILWMHNYTVATTPVKGSISIPKRFFISLPTSFLRRSYSSSLSKLKWWILCPKLWRSPFESRR